jgi:hypothetical protein
MSEASLPPTIEAAVQRSPEPAGQKDGSVYVPIGSDPMVVKALRITGMRVRIVLVRNGKVKSFRRTSPPGIKRLEELLRLNRGVLGHVRKK